MHINSILLLAGIFIFGCNETTINKRVTKETSNIKEDRSIGSYLNNNKAFAIQDNPKTNYYYQQGKKVEFKINKEVVGIQFDEKDYHALMNEESMIPNEIKELINIDRKTGNYSLFQSEVINRSDVDMIVNQGNLTLGSIPSFYPVMRKSNGAEGIILNQCILMFHKDTSEETINAIFSKYKIDKKNILSGNSKYKRYVINSPDMNVLDLSVQLEETKEVKYAHPDIIYKAKFDESYFSDQPASINVSNFHHKLLKTHDAFTKGIMGSPEVSIGIIDDGFISNHENFDGKQIVQYNTNIFTSNAEVNNSSQTHGTPMAGAAVGIYNNGNDIHGTCPECSLVLIKVSRSISRLATIIYDNLIEEDNLAIISMSISFYDYDTDLINSFEALHDYGRNNKGVLIFKSIGNENVMITNPYDLKLKDFVLSVTGSDSQDYLKTNYSKCSSCIDFVAPSTPITSPGVNLNNLSDNSTYDYAMHTSGSTAIAAGVAGLVLSTDVSLNANQLTNLLQENAIQIFSSPSSSYQVSYNPITKRSEYTGYGRIDAGMITAPNN